MGLRILRQKKVILLGDCKGGVKKNAIKGGVSVCLRLSTFARVCLRLLAFSPLRLLAFLPLRLSAFARVCSHLLTPPFVAPPPLCVTLISVLCRKGLGNRKSGLKKPPGTRATFSRFWGDFLTKLHSKPAKNEKYPLETVKKRWWGRRPKNADFCPLSWP